MPDGPVIMSPDRMIKSFQREVIYKKPQLFKITALKDIRSMFPEDKNPFVGGFGNRETDAISYRAVGIPLNNIFIINHDGEIYNFISNTNHTYPLLTDLVSQIFPVLEGAKQIKEAVES